MPADLTPEELDRLEALIPAFLWCGGPERPAADAYVEHVPALIAALRQAWAREAELRETLTASEEARKLYQEGKYALYAMGGEIQQAAIAHLPCGESGLDSRFRAFGETEKVQALRTELTRLRAALQEIQDICSGFSAEPCVGRVWMMAREALGEGAVPE